MFDVIFTLLSTLLVLKNKFYNTALQSRRKVANLSFYSLLSVAKYVI